MVLGYGSMLLRNILARVGLPVAQYGFAYVHPDGATLAQVAILVEEGSVRPLVEEENIYPLESAALAHGKVKQGHVRGKVVLEVVKETVGKVH